VTSAPGTAASGTDGASVEVAGLRHAFGGEQPLEVLGGVDLVAAPETFVSVVGPSGCGKTTLLRVLAGLTAPSAGTAMIDGVSVLGRPGRAAYMPQKDNLLPWRRVLGNATLGAEIAGIDRAEAQATARALFERFGLAGFESAWPSQLSGGMRQRLALLRTFLLRQRVLLLDEPFGALDAITRRQMYAWLQHVWLDDRRTVIFVTHDVDEAIYLSDVVVVFTPRPGRVAAVLEVDIDRPRRPELVTDPTFVSRKAEVLEALAG